MEKKTGLAVAMCCFKERQLLCETSIKRLERTVEIFRPGDRIFLLGDVPYEVGSKTLTDLGREYLETRDIPPEAIIITGGFDTFSSADATLAYVSKSKLDIEDIVLISSTWYLWVLVPVWRNTFKGTDIPITTERVTGTGGWRTHGIYAAYTGIVYICLTCGLLPAFKKHQLRIRKRREQGFTWQGCQ